MNFRELIVLADHYSVLQFIDVNVSSTKKQNPEKHYKRFLSELVGLAIADTCNVVMRAWNFSMLEVEEVYSRRQLKSRVDSVAAILFCKTNLCPRKSLRYLLLLQHDLHLNLEDLD